MLRFLTTFDFTLENILQLVVSAMVCLLLFFLTLRSLKPASIDDEGWSWIRPSLIHHFALWGSAAFSALMWWVYFFVGSVRADAASQENAMLLLATGFGAGAFLAWWLYYANAVSWKGTTIRATRFGTVIAQEDLLNLIGLREVKWRGQWRMEFPSGRHIYVSDMSHGFDDLGDVIEGSVP